MSWGVEGVAGLGYGQKFFLPGFSAPFPCRLLSTKEVSTSTDKIRNLEKKFN